MLGLRTTTICQITIDLVPILQSVAFFLLKTKVHEKHV
jgi:hypothetical protein